MYASISVESTPDVTPTPATINPTSPREIIPIPTLIDPFLSLRNIKDGGGVLSTEYRNDKS